MNNSSKNIFYFLMFLAMAGWGASWVSAKVLSSYINEYELIFFRNIFTIVTLIPILLITKKYFYINIRSLFLALIASIVMIIYMKCYFLGTKFGTASLGGALVTTLIPINTFLIMAIIFRKKIERKDTFALILGSIGVLTMLNFWSFKLEQLFKIENMYFLLASIFWPILTIVSSRITKTSPIVFTLYIHIISTIIVSFLFIDFNNINYASFDNIFWINILSLAIISTTFSTTIYFIGIEKLGTKEVSSFIFLVPFFAIILSVVFLKEEISLSIILGTILTIISVKILNNIKIFKRKI
ncbi:MAG: DMT family transporter [Arcobacter sp.]|nr:DMT family transporter [Arcobacter sp.]